ncbi:hypothetical protein ACJJTC_009844 [Scirpophaga incertulas]
MQHAHVDSRTCSAMSKSVVLCPVCPRQPSHSCIVNNYSDQRQVEPHARIEIESHIACLHMHFYSELLQALTDNTFVWTEDCGAGCGTRAPGSAGQGLSDTLF